MTIKDKMHQRNLKNAFRNEQGAIDLASIMVGIIVIGLIGGVIAATVFAVIPWAQDNAAKQQLDSIVAAENAHAGLSADDGPVYYFDYNPSMYDASQPGAYKDKVLLPAGIDRAQALSGVTAKGQPCYVAGVLSASGTAFFRSDSSNILKVNNFVPGQDYSSDSRFNSLYGKCNPTYWAD